MVVLMPLTTKEARKNFPTWTVEHQAAFDAIKALVVSWECLTVIDHGNMEENKVFVTCDASDWHTSATLAFGPTKCFLSVIRIVFHTAGNHLLNMTPYFRLMTLCPQRSSCNSQAQSPSSFSTNAVMHRTYWSQPPSVLHSPS
jgi:hypothetical protein